MTGNERLLKAVERARVRYPEGIGTQSERLVHCALKYYLEPDESAHEVRIPSASGGHVADIFQKERGHIYEIQTRGFGRLREKLTDFLSQYTVTVVYPAVRTKYLCWVDPETGEISKRRKSPRTGRFSDVLPEVYELEDLAVRPGLEVLVILLEVEEYRLLNGWSTDKKHGSSRIERLPLSIMGETVLKTAEDYRQLIPSNLMDPFFRTDLMRSLGLSGRRGSEAVTALIRTGAIEKIGQTDRKYIYARTRQEERH